VTKAKVYDLSPSPKSGPLPRELVEIAEFLKSTDLTVIDQTVEVWSRVAVKSPDVADRLLSRVGVSRAGESAGCLLPGPRFSHTDEVKNKILIYALLGLLSHAPSGSRGAYLRMNIEILDVITPDVPLLLGFTGLHKLDIKIEPFETQTRREPVDWQRRISGISSLQELKLVILEESFSPKSMRAFSSRKLRSVDVWGAQLLSLDGLEKSSLLCRVSINCLHERDSEYSISLDQLAPSINALSELKLAGCGVTDLSPISKCSHLQEISISNNNIENLRGLPLVHGESLTISVANNQIKSLEGIERQKKIKNLTILGTHCDGLELLGGLSNVETLDLVGDFHRLPDLSGMESLVRLRISSLELHDLPLKWPPQLRLLELEGCPNLTKLGELPATLQGCLDLSICKHLQALDGIEACTELEEVKINEACLDLTAAAQHHDLWFTLVLEGGSDPCKMPPLWVKQLASMESCKLRPVDYTTNSQRELADLKAFALIPGLRSLDISGLDLSDAAAVLEMQNLEYLQIKPRSDLSRKLRVTTISGEQNIAQLKLKLLALS
jgi:Leucine-rich repeat (LRR) protein